ncbi:MAG: sugar ABC transporter permease [Chloroflexi bacterium]|nr:sugar ABC transporter permease [Chloroflexota bacterium]
MAVAAKNVSQPFRRPPETGIRATLYRMRKEWTAYLFISPTLILFSIFTVFAVLFSFYISFHKWNILEPDKPFVGLANYVRLIEDERFHRAVINTFLFTVVGVPLTMGAGLSIALLLNNKIRFRGIYRTLYYIPNITPLVVSAIIWKWVYQGDYGLLNYYLIQLGIIREPLKWLSDPNLAMPAVILMGVWGGAGYQMVIYLAGLQAIPEEYYDAAKVDGANGFQRLRHITLPLLTPTTLFLFITSVIGSFQVFTQIYIMTNGGPLNRTTTIGFYLYEKAFRHFDMGYASAMAYALFAMILVFTIIQLRIMRREIQY